VTASTALSIKSVATATPVFIYLITVCIATLNISVFLIVSSSFTSQSPKRAVTDKIELAKSPVPPNREPTPFATATNACLTMSITANKPLNVLFKFSEFVSLSFRCAVRFLNASVMLYSCCAVIGGKISRNASFTGLIILSTPSKAFLAASISAVLPPKSFQPCNILFLASADEFIIALNASLISVSNSFASSKSPTIISQL